MGDIIFGIGWLSAMIALIIITICDTRKAKRESEKLNEIYKAMIEASKYAEPGTPEHAKKTAELFEKEEKVKK